MCTSQCWPVFQHPWHSEGYIYMPTILYYETLSAFPAKAYESAWSVDGCHRR